MHLTLTINNESRNIEVTPQTRLLDALRTLGYFGVKHGCEDGSCGACTLLLDGRPTLACVTLAAQAAGHAITTIEGIGDRDRLHALQQAFVENGAIQCGYCTPAMILVAGALLARNPHPTETEVRDALSGVLCRCTGYVKPVQAILRAAASPQPTDAPSPLPGGTGEGQNAHQPAWNTVGHPEPKVDARKLVQGNPAFTADYERRDMLHARLLLSPHPHARIRRIEAGKARALPGVHAVLTHHDLPRVPFSTAGQSDPIPGPLDHVSLDDKVRFAGDRVAAVAAETPEIAAQALALIEVDYEPLPPLLDPAEAMRPGAPRIHDQPDYVPFDESDPARNLAAQIELSLGDVEQGFAEADLVLEETYRVPRVSHVAIEPHVCLTYWDEDDRLVIHSSTQVPFHARRVLAPVLGLPVKQIRVIKPRIGGGFGGKQEVLIEDTCAHLTIATGRPVRLEYSRTEEFVAATVRHPMIVTLRTGVLSDGTIVAQDMHVLSDTGAYGNHAMTVAGNTAHKTMALYHTPNLHFHADVVYTNTIPSGAMRGYGVPQGFFPLEVHIERIARRLGLDPLVFRLQNAVREGDEHPISKIWTEGREGRPEVIRTCALPQCVEQGAAAIGWHDKFGNEAWHSVPGKPHLRRGIGVACVMQGTAIAYLDMGAASIKMNDDGSFNLLVGATDLGTGSDTVLAQMAAEVLGCPLEDILVYSSDTDFTPFDTGAYASSTTYVSGSAVVRAAEQAAAQIRRVAANMLRERAGADAKPVTPDDIMLHDRHAFDPAGRSVSLAEVALHALHHADQHQIMGTGSYVSEQAPPPFAAQFAEVTVDTETGEVRVDRLVMALDCGTIINPATASGQVEGGMIQALGYTLCEEMLYDENGQPLTTDLHDYHIFLADEVPDMQVIFVETHEPTGPFGAKAVAEIPMDGVAPAVANALYDATGVPMTEIPLTPERVWRRLAG